MFLNINGEKIEYKIDPNADVKKDYKELVDVFCEKLNIVDRQGFEDELNILFSSIDYKKKYIDAGFFRENFFRILTKYGK